MIMIDVDGSLQTRNSKNTENESEIFYRNK